MMTRARGSYHNLSAYISSIAPSDYGNPAGTLRYFLLCIGSWRAYKSGYFGNKNCRYWLALIMFCTPSHPPLVCSGVKGRLLSLMQSSLMSGRLGPFLAIAENSPSIRNYHFTYDQPATRREQRSRFLPFSAEVERSFKLPTAALVLHSLVLRWPLASLTRHLRVRRRSRNT